MSLVVAKVGGAAAAGAVRDVEALVFQKHKVVVVHGAGPQITAEMERRGLPVEFVAGRRVTTPEALEVARESMAGVNAALCAALGAQALPLPDGVLEAVPVAGLGLVGDPVPSAPRAIVDALAAGRVPIVAPLARESACVSETQARLLNVNGDEAAVALALGLGADRLVFITDVPGVLLDGVVTPALAAAEAERLAGAWEGGIVPKLLAAARAARLGVEAEIGATAVTA